MTPIPRLARLTAALLVTALPSVAALSSWALHDMMGVGINYGEYFESKSKKSQILGVIPTQEIDAIWNAGFRHIRIPVTWGYRLTENPTTNDIRVNDTFMANVKSSVNYALGKGFVVILNVHHDFDISKNTSPWSYEWGAKDNFATDITNVTGIGHTVKYVFEEIWRDIADNFPITAANGEKLIFEILNEPPKELFTIAEVNAINTAGVNAVTGRPNQEGRVFMLSVQDDNSAWKVGDTTIPAGLTTSRVIKTFHNYNPWSFCSPDSTQPNWNDWPEMNNVITTAKNGAGGAPLNMGEFGVGHRVGVQRGSESLLRWYRAAATLAKKQNITPTVWHDGGAGNFRVFNSFNASFDFQGDIVDDEIWKTVTLEVNKWKLDSRADAAKSFSTLNNNTGVNQASALHTTQNWASQRVTFIYADQYDRYYIRNDHGNYIGNASGAVRQETTTLANETDRKWELRCTGEGFHYLKPENSGNFLDLFNDATAAGTSIVIRTPDYTASQQWELVFESHIP